MYVYTYICIYIYIHIYIQREREREIVRYVHIYIYMYTKTAQRRPVIGRRAPGAAALRASMDILAIFYPPLKYMWDCVWLFLQAQGGNIYFRELAERVEYGNYDGGGRKQQDQRIFQNQL